MDLSNTFSEFPYYWTIERIMQAPTISRWFYGLVIDEMGRIVISEIHPGLGYDDIRLEEVDWIEPGKPANIEKQFAEIASDIMHWNPQRVAECAAEEGEYDYDCEPVHIDTIPAFVDDRSPFLRLLDARWLLDYVLENRTSSFRFGDVENLGGKDTREWIDVLLRYGVIKESGEGVYRFDKYNPLSSEFKRIYDTVEKWSEWEKTQR